MNLISALIDAIKQMMVKLDENMWGCASCDFKTKYDSTLRNHIEAKHLDTGGFVCQYCSATCPNRQALRMHLSRKHRNLCLQ